MQSFNVYLLGAPRFEQEGEKFHIPRRKSVALLAYLITSSQIHTRDSLATMFWPEHDQSSARANLRRELSRLKKALGEEAFAITKEQVGIQQEARLGLDVAVFQSRLSDVQTRIQETNGCLEPEIFSTCMNELKGAIELYRGDFMAGFSLLDSPNFDEWQFFQTENLRSLFAEALQQLIQWQIIQGEYARAIEHARRWLSLDKLHEPAHRKLMQLYAWSEKQSAALRQYQECKRLLKIELGIEPEEETTQLYEAIKTRQLDLPEVEEKKFIKLSTMNGIFSNEKNTTEQPATESEQREFYRDRKEEKSNSGAHLSSTQPILFIGRENEKEQLSRLLVEDPNCRLLSIVGPGGVGKTSLALEAASESLEAFEDGVYFIPLSQLTSADHIVPALAKQLRFRFHEAAEPKKQLLDYLREMKVLLVMDNFEHLLQGTGLLVDILHTAPGVKLLSTSRERLNLSDEVVFTLSGMRFPDFADGLVPDTDLTDYDAVELFITSTRKVKPDFELQRKDYEHIARICHLIEGMPLAIVMAAGWMEMLSPKEVADEIASNLDFLETQAQDIPERQRSIRAVFNASWSLLEDQEKDVLKRLTVFQSSFTRQAAQAVTGTSLKNLLNLMRKSWLHRSGHNRFQIHELLCQYTSEKVEADATTLQEAKDKFSSYYADLLQEQIEVMHGPSHEEAFIVVAEDFENIRAAWHWLVDQKRFDMIVDQLLPALYYYFQVRAKSYELFQLVELTLAELEDESEITGNIQFKAIMLTAKASFYRKGDPIRFDRCDIMLPAYEEAIHEAWSLIIKPQDLKEMGLWGALLAYLYGRFIDHAQGRTYLMQLVQDYRVNENIWELAFVLELLGSLNVVASAINSDKGPHLEEAGHCLEEAYTIFKQIGDERESGYTLMLRGSLFFHQQSWTQAVRDLETAQSILESVGDMIPSMHWFLGDLYLRLGEFEAFFKYFNEISTTYIKMGYKRVAAYSLSKESTEALRYSDIEHARQTRERSLDLSREVDDIFGEAWSTWEMGEIYRVANEIEEARQWYEKARVLFNKVGDPYGLTFYHRGLGDIALTTGDENEANHQFQVSLEYAGEANYDWGMAYALVGLGRASICLGEIEDAQAFISDALQRAQNSGEIGLVLFVLAGYARLYAATGQTEQAIELCELIFGHYASWSETKAQAEDLFSEISELMPGQLRTVRGGDQIIDVMKMADRLLKESTLSERS